LAFAKNFDTALEGITVMLSQRGWMRLLLLALCFGFTPVRADEPSVGGIDTGKLDVGIEKAFPKLKWADWEPTNDKGLPAPFRPILLTHANDDSGRVFVASQQGRIYVFKNDQDVTESNIFLDIREKVRYSDKENEEGFLGLAFHPNYKENGEFFAYYTAKSMPRESVISRFRVSKDNPDLADAASEEELMRVAQPFWNHNGGTVIFGLDGYLYIALGDGGAANDPHGNGQNLDTLLGSILRIDVDKTSSGRPYGIPADNPFVGKANARPEIYAYGLRNVWRMAFDPETKLFWAADVGQDLWEEIDLIEKGGNYGWNVREGLHPFKKGPATAASKLIEPIWEYNHEIGKSITGGMVYRGKRVPKLVGKYVYADYVTGKIWALEFDPKTKRVLSNNRIESPMMPIITFGEDENSEIYFSIVAPDGRGLYRFSAGN
jgi:quinoprotein glucose dehydrogenase